ncbi:MAG: pentapeptide repeat-containing protein [Cyanobacteriota bacterium]|nr:pentapeptide repeat-containing protein [Cyanobacteriota bacterium]
MLTTTNFSHKNFQGRSFKGQNLAGANFSHADIRGADFTDANLTDANFSQARAGLTPRSKWIILLVAAGLAAIAGGCIVINIYLSIKYLAITGKNFVYIAVINIIFNTIFWFVILRQSIQRALIFVIVTTCSVVAVTVFFSGIRSDNYANVPVLKYLELFMPLSSYRFREAIEQGLSADSAANLILTLVVLLLTGIIAVFCYYLAKSIAVIASSPKISKWIFYIAQAVAVPAAGGTIKNKVRRAVSPEMLPRIAVFLLGVFLAYLLVYLCNRTAKKVLTRDPEYAIVRNLAVGIAAIRGTSFRRANLTNSHFSSAILKSSDFRDATITHARWYNAEKLDWARLGNTILIAPPVRDLLATLNGSNKSYIGANFKGANLINADLSDANLREADLSEAILENANLEGANLAQTQAIGTNFTNAKLTDAYGLGTWNIDSTTNLEWVHCQQVYLLENFKPGTRDKERRPSSGEFGEGEFTKLFQEVLNTVDLIFQKGIDWKAFTYSFQQVQVENEEIPLNIQAIENKGDGVVVVRVEVPPEANKAKIHSEFTQTYQDALAALEAQYQEKLQDHRQRSANMMEVVRLLASRDVNYEVVPPKAAPISGKLAILKIGNGDFENGFNVTLQIGAEGALPSTEIQSNLPPNPEVYELYQDWQTKYRELDSSLRIKKKKGSKTNWSIYDNNCQDCQKSAQRFAKSLNGWLNSQEFRKIKDTLQTKIEPSEEFRFIVKAESMLLGRIPWQLWDYFDSYRQVEIALSTPEYYSRETPTSTILRTKVRILAILGNSQGINVEKDREMLAKLPKADTRFLAEPKREEVNVHLWDEGGWDILFFAGHSSSEGEIGNIYINSKDKLTIAELKYALRRAVERGLKLAIFNSCDGLALAKELADLHIPQIIVMREPVMDRVAGEFLQHFIQAYAGGKSLSGAVREARERLQGLEDKFPCASWLPVICQHPAEVPPTWQRLRGIVAGEDNQELLELVAKLREAVEADLDLSAEDKADVLEQVQFLGRAANSPLEVLSQRQGRKAMIFIRGAIASLPPTAKLLSVAEELLEAIARLFGL